MCCQFLDIAMMMILLFAFRYFSSFDAFIDLGQEQPKHEF